MLDSAAEERKKLPISYAKIKVFMELKTGREWNAI